MPQDEKVLTRISQVGAPRAGYRTFRIADLAYPCQTSAPVFTLWITFSRLPYTAGVGYIIANIPLKSNLSAKLFQKKFMEARPFPRGIFSVVPLPRNDIVGGHLIQRYGSAAP